MCSKIPPRSCDTFAVLPPGTTDGCIVFGKNSDRPSDEVQEVVFHPSTNFDPSTPLRCTYIEVEQVARTHAVVLSKPAWMWGAEMGANEHGVCIGNEAVWTVLNDESDSEEKLLGMDLLRLGLERGATALEALHVITGLIEKYGMGGNCSDTLDDFTYHNSFLIADSSEVWILECAGKIWAAERVVEGVRNISNELTIRDKIDLKCGNLDEFATSRNLWNPSSGPLNFKKSFCVEDCESHRYLSGKRLLTNYSTGGRFGAEEMFKVLRDKPSGICMSRGSFVSTGSQVSVLRKPDSGLPSIHWFTATPDPSVSMFKPFIFTENVEFPNSVVSPIPGVSSSMVKIDRRHDLYKLHSTVCGRGNSTSNMRSKLQDLELKYVKRARDLSLNFENSKVSAGTLFKDAAEEESALYGRS